MATKTKKMTYGADGQTQIETDAKTLEKPGDNERRSFFDDDEGDGLYSGKILLDGLAVRVREMSAGEIDRYKSDVRAIDAIAKKPTLPNPDFAAIAQEALDLLACDENNAQIVAQINEKASGDTERGDDEHAELAADAIAALRRACCMRVICTAVTGWDLTRPNGTAVPFSRENAAKLRFSAQNELTDKIVQRSVFGVDFSGFLAPS